MELLDGFLIDLDVEGRLVGIEVLNPHKRPFGDLIDQAEAAARAVDAAE